MYPMKLYQKILLVIAGLALLSVSALLGVDPDVELTVAPAAVVVSP